MSSAMQRVAFVFRPAVMLACRREQQRCCSVWQRTCKRPAVCAKLLKSASRRLLMLAVVPAPLLIIKDTDMSSQDEGTLKKKLQHLLLEADKLLQIYEFSKVYDLLYPYKDVDDVELLWRLTKAAYEITRITKDKKLARRLDNDGYHWIERAFKINDHHPEVHKMMAIMLDAYHKHEGVKARLSKTNEVKQHMITASELNPSDPHPFYMLGWWYYSIADLPWAHVQIARILFSSPMEATFEEALQCFEQALERDKDHSRFYMMNLVMLGKTHLKLGQKKQALKYLKQVSEYQPSTSQDREACVEAATLMTQLGSNTEPKSSREVTK